MTDHPKATPIRYEDARRTPRVRRAAFALLAESFSSGSVRKALSVWNAPPKEPLAGDQNLRARDRALWLAWMALRAADNEAMPDPGDPPPRWDGDR